MTNLDNQLFWAFEHKDFVKYKTLIEAGADINAQSCTKKTPLHYAISCKSSKYANLLLEAGADVNVKDISGCTPLHIVMNRPKKAKLVKKLIDMGANVNVQNNIGRTPLHIAMYNQYFIYAALLLDAGANQTTKTENNETPLDCLNRKVKIKLFKKLFVAMIDDNVKKIKKLIDMGADINLRLKRTILHHAVYHKKIDCTKILLEAGANVNQADIYDTTPLHTAVSNCYYDKDIELVKFLIEQGADVFAKDSNGATPLDLAEFDKCANLLKEAMKKND